MKFNKINEWKPRGITETKQTFIHLPVMTMRPSTRMFSNESSFTKYYNANPAEFEGKTTQTLNKQFKIKGYTLAQMPDDEGIMHLHLCRVKLKPDWEAFEELERRISALEELMRDKNKTPNGELSTECMDSKELSKSD